MNTESLPSLMVRLGAENQTRQELEETFQSLGEALYLKKKEVKITDHPFMGRTGLLEAPDRETVKKLILKIKSPLAFFLVHSLFKNRSRGN